METAKDNREHLDKEEITELKTELSEHVKSLDQLANEIENSICEPDTLQINDSGDNWTVTCGEMYNKLKSHQEMIMFLVGEHRQQEKAGRKKEQEMLLKQQEEDQKQHEVEINKLIEQFSSSCSARHKKVKRPELNIPTFDGEPTNWKSYWQQFEATIHNSTKLTD